MSTAIKITPKIINDICAYVRAGGFPHVAAEAAGVPMEIFQKWLERGEQKDCKKLYRLLATSLRQAVAEARIKAETQALQDAPMTWLKSGPGRDIPGKPGWSATVKPHITQDHRQINILLDPSIVDLFRAILQVLAPYPEARAAVAQALAGGEEQPIALEHKPAGVTPPAGSMSDDPE